jgi:membrane fusion protein
VEVFRPEVIEARRRRLFGEVTIHQPARLAVFTALLVATTAGAALFLVFGSYARTEMVTGWIAPEAGLAQVFGPKAGVMSAVDVDLGDEVALGQALARVSTDVEGASGALSAEERKQTTKKISEADYQIRQSDQQGQLETHRLEQQFRSLNDEATYLERERSLAEQQLVIGRRQLEQIAPLVAQGFMSQIERDRRQQLVTGQEQAVVEITRQVAAKRSAAEDTKAQIDAVTPTRDIANSELRASRAGLVQSLAEYDVQGNMVITSPIHGRIAAVNVHSGDTLTPASPLFAIAPVGGHLTAEIMAPTRSAGFITVGQPVRLMIDAFPSQRFGPLEGRVAAVSHAAINPGQIATPVPLKEPAYRIVVQLSDDSIRAYGKAQPLQPGMTLKAYIATTRQTFFEWMIDPLLAAHRRA